MTYRCAKRGCHNPRYGESLCYPHFTEVHRRYGPIPGETMKQIELAEALRIVYHRAVSLSNDLLRLKSTSRYVVRTRKIVQEIRDVAGRVLELESPEEKP